MAVPNAELHPLWTMRNVTTESGRCRHWILGHGLACIIVSHGAAITQDPAAVLKKIAAPLDG